MSSATRRRKWPRLAVGILVLLALGAAPTLARSDATGSLDRRLGALLVREGFTGRVESTLTRRLGRPLDPRLVETGRVLWFDNVTSLNGDNTCGGCHSPTAGFGDTQSIAIGIDNNGVVGPDRTGPRNQRRAPMVVNTAFYPRLMWNGRFEALSGDPFDPSLGLSFPAPEGLTLSYLPHLLTAQAFIPPTERNEAAGFDVPGDSAALRAEVLRRLNAIPAYRRLFGRIFPEVRQGGPITFDMVGRAIAEFEFSLTFADAPIDRYARGERSALTDEEKEGAVLFFGQAGCVTCHTVAGGASEMFSDFREHVIGVPQIVPAVTNSVFDGPGADEDFGREQVTGDPGDRYAFRTSPLRNVGLQPTFMHNGAFTTLEDAVVHHLDVIASALAYDPARAGVDADLRGPPGPSAHVLARLDPLIAEPVALSSRQREALVAFVRNGLLDPRARPERLRRLVPEHVPSGQAIPEFQFPAPAQG